MYGIREGTLKSTLILENNQKEKLPYILVYPNNLQVIIDYFYTFVVLYNCTEFIMLLCCMYSLTAIIYLLNPLKIYYHLTLIATDK